MKTYTIKPLEWKDLHDDSGGHSAYTSAGTFRAWSGNPDSGNNRFTYDLPHMVGTFDTNKVVSDMYFPKLAMAQAHCEAMYDIFLTTMLVVAPPHNPTER